MKRRRISRREFDATRAPEKGEREREREKKKKKN